MEHEGSAKALMEAMLRLKRVTMSEALSVMRQRDFFILRYIKLHEDEHPDGVQISALAKAQHITMPAVSQFITALEDKGYLERHTRREDRRAVYVRMTEAGEKAYEEKLEAFLRLHGELHRRFGEENVLEFARLCNRLADVMEELKTEFK